MPEYGESLSQRELEVLHCVTEGSPNKEIALRLAISQNTVKVHLRNIYHKLGVSSRTEATMVAIQQGIVQLPGTEAIEPEDVPSGGDPRPEDNDSPTTSLGRGMAPSLGPETIPPESRMAGLRSGWLRYRTPLLLLVATVILFLSGLLALQGLDEASEPDSDPFIEAALGESGWFESRPLPEPRANMAVAAVGLAVYQIGGETASGTVDTVSAFDTTAHVWREAAAKPTAVSDVTAAVLFGEIYVPGGRLADGRPTDIVEAYSPTNDGWRTVAALPQPVSGGLALSDGSFLYLLGGWDGEQYLDVNYVYDVGADSWRPLSPLPHARAFAAGSAVTGSIYVVGGYDGVEELSLCHFLDVGTGEWNVCPDMLLPRAGAGAAVVLNKLYVIGGGLDSRSEVAFSEVFDPNGATWQVVNTPILAETSSWSHLGVANVEVRIYAMGGKRGDTRSSGNFVFAPPVYRTFIPAASTGLND
jgi:DNA-binding CsgD family transcriptional regulator